MIKFLDLAPDPELFSQLHIAYSRVMSSGRYIGGDEVAGFEAEWADYLGADHCVGCGNGFDALQLILMAYGIGRNDLVLVPTHTCAPTWAAVYAVGACPVGYDDIEDISERISPSASAIIAVHLYGTPADIDRIQELKRYPHIRVIEDAAQAHGSIYKGRKCGTLADAAAWSFYPTKNLGAYGDGGAVTTNDAALAARVRVLGNYGERGAINSRLDPLQAAFLRVKLERLDGWNLRRWNNAHLYWCNDISNYYDPQAAWFGDDYDYNFHQFVIAVDGRHVRAMLRNRLLESGIETMIHYPRPPHLDYGYKRGDFPKAERWADTVLSLPVGPHLGETDIMRVVEAIREFEG